MKRNSTTGYRAVFPSNKDPKTTYFFKFTWEGEIYRSTVYPTPKQASDAYKKHFLKVVKESFEND